jgi:HSP20 family protein
MTLLQVVARSNDGLATSVHRASSHASTWIDEGKVLRVTAELPGMERDDVDVSVEDGAIVLRGEKKQDVRSAEDGCYRLERAYGCFMRTIPMPENADPDHALAKFDNGVLTLTVPKTEPARSASRTIDIE